MKKSIVKWRRFFYQKKEFIVVNSIYFRPQFQNTEIPPNLRPPYTNSISRFFACRTNAVGRFLKPSISWLAIATCISCSVLYHQLVRRVGRFLSAYWSPSWITICCPYGFLGIARLARFKTSRLLFCWTNCSKKWLSPTKKIVFD